MAIQYNVYCYIAAKTRDMKIKSAEKDLVGVSKTGTYQKCKPNRQAGNKCRKKCKSNACLVRLCPTVSYPKMAQKNDKLEQTRKNKVLWKLGASK